MHWRRQIKLQAQKSPSPFVGVYPVVLGFITQLFASKLLGLIFENTPAQCFHSTRHLSTCQCTIDEKLTNQTKPIFIDSAVADEAASVKIINGSQVPGAGALFKRLVTNLGGRVVGVDSQKSSATIIKVSTDKKKLATKISRFLDTKVEREKGEPAADVVIILGADLVKKLDLN